MATPAAASPAREEVRGVVPKLMVRARWKSALSMARAKRGTG